MAHKQEADVLSSLAENLTRARNRAGMTQKQLSEATGIYQADISKMERGLANPSVSTLQRLADGMDMTLKIEFISRKKKREVGSMILCEECGFGNLLEGRYCQSCGKRLKVKKNIRKQLKGADPGTLMGAGGKGVSIAPLLSDTVTGSGSSGTDADGAVPILRTLAEPFYCTSCGAGNKAHALSCVDCGRYFSYVEREG